ncbi:MAG: hypothetical protein CMM56_04910 [Rhodospirillaceae bacterium]|nr:hypothetical protein [Rhodospirillaceae bacterium]|tara:strand:- start:2520 stop:3383 length:864 start_codon:yes stop_codon:yes gene_type:complete
MYQLLGGPMTISRGFELVATVVCSILVLPSCSTDDTPLVTSNIESTVAPIDLSGVWSTNSFDTLDNPAWDIVGQFSARLTSETYDYLQTLLYDPANDHLSAAEIIEALEDHTFAVIDDRLTEVGHSIGDAFDLADDPAIQCENFGVFRTVLHSDPIEFEVLSDRLIIRGEDLTINRTIYMDGRSHPQEGIKTSGGHSIGWYEGSTLVIETVDVTPNLADDTLAIHNSDQARGVERYTISEDGMSMDVEFTIHDPVMLIEPLTIRRPRVFTPDVELDRRPCEAISGQF